MRVVPLIRSRDRYDAAPGTVEILRQPSLDACNLAPATRQTTEFRFECGYFGFNLYPKVGRETVQAAVYHLVIAWAPQYLASCKSVLLQPIKLLLNLFSFREKNAIQINSLICTQGAEHSEIELIDNAMQPTLLRSRNDSIGIHVAQI